MWDKPFEIEMLANENGVVINCPTVEAYMEMARVLEVEFITGLSIVQKRHLGEVTQNVRFMA